MFLPVSHSFHGKPRNQRLVGMLLFCITAVLTACGGGGGSSTTSTGTTPSVLATSASLANVCATPRANTSDVQGTADNEKAFLRSFVDETYLWYKDVPSGLVPANYATPQSYFDALKTTKTTASGRPLDQFHWSQKTASWNASSSGLGQGYGITWAGQVSTLPRTVYVVAVAPGSAAALAGVKRGDQLTAVDGIDFLYTSTSAAYVTFNDALSSDTINTHTLGINSTQSFTLIPKNYSVQTVQNVKTIATSTGTVGYFTFDEHIAKSEAELIAAFNQLKAAGVKDLVIDMRYNGGGLLYIASELAYMIAGTASTSGKTFEQIVFNDKLSAQNYSFPFYSSGYSSGTTLPHLDLSHVTVLTSYGTASASESVINSLRGVDVKVDLIGASTRGKPYGFAQVPDNCGYTYFALQFKGVNQKGFGDYADGFTPNCTVADDLSHVLGDTAERMLSAALSYRKTGVCPIAASATAALKAGSASGATALIATQPQAFELLRPPSMEMRLLVPASGL